MVLYKSTRGGESGVSFEQVLLSTYADDGGLYVPEYIPQLSRDALASLSGATFHQVCAHIMHLYTGLEIDLLHDMATRAFKDFNNGAQPPLPITRVQGLLLLDASLGPTLAFKDIGQQMVGQLLDYYLGRSGRKANILVDTSGDTGPAAIAAVVGCKAAKIYCLYPKGRVSAVQELQMITVLHDNVHVYRTEGNNDDQSSVLKEIFEDRKFVAENDICCINSINWARIAAQSTYYVWAYLQVYNTTMSIGEKVVFSIPTGAFGNAMGGYLAKMMGLPIARIICATNLNDIVHRTISRGDMSMSANLATHSPAMDIQFAYNVERMLFYMCNQDPAMTSLIMKEVDLQFSQQVGSRGAQLDPLLVGRIQELFVSCSVSDDETLNTIREFQRESNFSLCPHSAIGVHAAKHIFASITSTAPTFCVLTANPAKFEKTFEAATGSKPEMSEAVKQLKDLPQRYKTLCKKDDSWRSVWVDTLKGDILTSL